MIARYELAQLLFVADNHNAPDATAEWDALPAKYLLPYYLMADAVIAAGYEKP